jgi:hypothetical protein
MEPTGKLMEGTGGRRVQNGPGEGTRGKYLQTTGPRVGKHVGGRPRDARIDTAPEELVDQHGLLHPQLHRWHQDYHLGTL